MCSGRLGFVWGIVCPALVGVRDVPTTWVLVFGNETTGRRKRVTPDAASMNAPGVLTNSRTMYRSASRIRPCQQRGERWADHGTVLNNIFWILNSNAKERDMPVRSEKW